MAVNLSPVGGAAAQFFNNNGGPLAGGKIYTYAANTTTNQATYTSYSGATAHTNPIILDSAGRVPGGEIWLTNGLQYKFIVKTSTEVLIGTYNNITGINGVAFTNTPANYTGNGVTTIFTLPATPINENWTQVYVSGVYQFKNTYSVSGTSLIFSEAPPATSNIEVLY
jgi:hypothetical protein